MKVILYNTSKNYPKSMFFKISIKKNHTCYTLIKLSKKYCTNFLILRCCLVRFTPQRFRPRQKLEREETFHRTCQKVKEAWNYIEFFYGIIFSPPILDLFGGNIQKYLCVCFSYLHKMHFLLFNAF